MKQTAVEWLKKELETYGDPEYCKIEWETLDELIDQAKAMEKEQIIDAFFEGKNDGILMERYSDYEHITPDEYYNETFKSE